MRRGTNGATGSERYAARASSASHPKLLAISTLPTARSLEARRDLRTGTELRARGVVSGSMSPRPPQRPLDCAALLIVGLTLAACGEDAPSEPATPERAAPSEVPGEAPAREPRAPAPPAAHEPPPANLPSAPTSGCALGAPRLVVAG